MVDTTAFIAEAVIVSFFSVIVLCFCLRQLYYDISNSEKWRPLIICHYLTAVASVLLVIGNVDPQGGLAVYPEAFAQFNSQIRTMFLLSSAQALAVGFVASHQLMTQGTKQESKGWLFLSAHAVYNVTACILFLVQMITRNVPAGIASRSAMMLYSLIVSIHTIVSALQVRKILKEENARTGKYAEGIYKLTRLVVLVAVLVIIGNATMVVTMQKTIALVKTTHTFVDEGVSNFSAFNIFSDFAGLVSLVALITGSWKVSAGPAKSSSSRRTTRGSTTTSGRKSTPKLASREVSDPASDTEAGPPTEVNSPSPTIGPVELPPQVPIEILAKKELEMFASPVKTEVRKFLPDGTDAELSGDEDSSGKRRRKLGKYQELEVV